MLGIGFIALTAVALIAILNSGRTRRADPGDLSKVQGQPFRAASQPAATSQIAPVATTRPAATSPVTQPGNPRAASISPPGMIPITIDTSKLATIGKDVDDDGTIHLSIDQLACYPYDMLAMNDWLHDPESGPRPQQIPKEVLALNGRTVEVRGYMMPITMFDTGTPMFLLLRDQAACCFGMAHGMNAWVRVEMRDKQLVGYVRGTPIAVRGVLDVGEEAEDEMVMSLYRLHGEQVRRLDGY